MALIEVDWNPSARALRWFGVGTGALAGLLGALSWSRGSSGLGICIWVAGAGFLVLFWGVRALRLPLYVAWMRLVHPLGQVLSHALFGVVWYLVVTPLGVAMRLLGRDPLQRRREADRASYWSPRAPTRDVKRYFEQY